MTWGIRPYWTETVLQGLTYWFGYHKQIFRNYPLSEGAIVAEACKLIAGELKDNFYLECELMYANILPRPQTFFESTERADLIVTTKRIKKEERYLDISSSVDTIIEVKRYSSSKIDDDLKRLRDAHEACKGKVSCFLIVASTEELPEKFVNTTNGEANPTETGMLNGKYKVRRACKAVASFKKGAIGSAYYACLIEVRSS